jgi:C_GCAxxG_C_C family probable redox protein
VKKTRGLGQQWRPRREATYGEFPFVAATREKIVDAIAETAFTSLGVYGNCCRSVLWAVQIHLRRENASILRAGSVLAGGVCGSGKTCGAVIGGMIAVGEALASADFGDLERYRIANAAAAEFVERMRDVYVSTDCYDIQTAVMRWCCNEHAKQEERTAAGGPTACAGVAAEGARLAAKIILAHADEPGFETHR